MILFYIAWVYLNIYQPFRLMLKSFKYSIILGVQYSRWVNKDWNGHFPSSSWNNKIKIGGNQKFSRHWTPTENSETTNSFVTSYQSQIKITFFAEYESEVYQLLHSGLVYKVVINIYLFLSQSCIKLVPTSLWPWFWGLRPWLIFISNGYWPGLMITFKLNWIFIGYFHNDLSNFTLE